MISFHDPLFIYFSFLFSVFFLWLSHPLRGDYILKSSMEGLWDWELRNLFSMMSFIKEEPNQLSHIITMLLCRFLPNRTYCFLTNTRYQTDVWLFNVYNVEEKNYITESHVNFSGLHVWCFVLLSYGVPCSVNNHLLYWYVYVIEFYFQYKQNNPKQVGRDTSWNAFSCRRSEHTERNVKNHELSFSGAHKFFSGILFLWVRAIGHDKFSDEGGGLRLFPLSTFWEQAL